MLCLIKRLVNYIRFRKVARQIDKRELRKLIPIQKFMESFEMARDSYVEELKRALQK